MSYTIEPIAPSDGVEIIDIFNYYIEHSFAAYPEQKVPYEFFDMLLKMSQGYPAVAVKNESDEIVGFGLLRPYSSIPTFSITAEIAYFFKPGFTGKGIGKSLLDHLLKKAKERGITSILASVSSLNNESIKFHTKHGFSECGRFSEIGRKKDVPFDVIYFQRKI